VVGELLRQPNERFREVIHGSFTKEKLDHPDGSFDWVISSNVLHGTADDHLAISEFIRCCAAGGVIQIQVPEPAKRLKTFQLERKAPGDVYRIYGIDLTGRLADLFPFMKLLVVKVVDRVTDEPEIVYLMSSSEVTIGMLDKEFRRESNLSALLVN
jgi:SAM-dependent methyltransferase